MTFALGMLAGAALVVVIVIAIAIYAAFHFTIH